MKRCSMVLFTSWLLRSNAFQPLKSNYRYAASRLYQSTQSQQQQQQQQLINLSTITKSELQTVVTSWGYPKYRADQVWQWLRVQGVTDVHAMSNLPAKLREQLAIFSKPASLTVLAEQRSKDGTIKRAYQCVDGQVIESVLMPYDDGRYTACISSQAGCAQGCVFCATGQMGFARQLTDAEIFEQVNRFATELAATDKRLSNIVFMGMGEPLANYKQVKSAIERINSELEIGARKITVSTVGIVPNIRKLMQELPQVRLAVSLHCATDEERNALLPANRRYGGLKELMSVLKEYIDTTGRRITLEWALIEQENDSIETARQLGQLIVKHQLRRDMVHVNVIPLNPTGGYSGAPSNRGRVNVFCKTLTDEFGIACTPRVRRGIDIDAGCGQLKSEVMKKIVRQSSISFDDTDDDTKEHNQPLSAVAMERVTQQSDVLEADKQTAFQISEAAVDFESEDYDDPEFETDFDKAEAERLIALVKGQQITLGDIPEPTNRKTAAEPK